MGGPVKQKIDCMVVLSLCFGFILAGHLRSDEVDIWNPLKPLVGKWRGEGSGFGDVSDVTHEWKFVLRGKFLRLRTKSITRTKDKAGEFHEDTGFLSRDTDHDKFVFRQFLSEGFVNTFEVILESEER
jgi:hypothetical protein